MSITTRILLVANPGQGVENFALTERIVGALESACDRYPDTFTRNSDGYYAYETETRALMVLWRDDLTNFLRLTIPGGEHVVFDNLAALVWDHHKTAA